MSYLLAFLLSIGLVAVTRQWAQAWGLMDHPGEHRGHEHPTPMVGGICICAAVLAGSLLVPMAEEERLSLWTAGLLITIVGAMDDRRPVSSGVRFCAQAVSVGIVAWIADISLRDLGLLFDGVNPVHLGRWGIALTIFAAVGVINSVNMSDGMDGLATCLALVTCVSLLFSAWLNGDSFHIPLIALLIAASLGFLVFNMRYGPYRHARVYLGDSGSMFIGLVLAWLMVDMSQDERRVIAPVTALWLFALPLYDTVGVMLRRLIRRKSPFLADRNHYHHYARALGLGVTQTLLLSVAVAGLFAAVGLFAESFGVPEHVMFYSFLTGFVVYVLLMELVSWRISRSP